MNNPEHIRGRAPLNNGQRLLQYKGYVLAAIGTVIVAGIAIYLAANKSNDQNLLASSADVSIDTESDAADGSGTLMHQYDYTEAPKHIGERVTVRGTIVKTFTAKSGVTFLDFCSNAQSCPFSAVIFKDDLPKFGDLKRYVRAVKLTGVIKSYEGKAEMVLDNPDQIE